MVEEKEELRKSEHTKRLGFKNITTEKYGVFWLAKWEELKKLSSLVGTKREECDFGSPKSRLGGRPYFADAEEALVSWESPSKKGSVWPRGGVSIIPSLKIGRDCCRTHGWGMVIGVAE